MPVRLKYGLEGLEMQQSFHAMETALRVLSALTEKRIPEESDVQELIRIAGTKPAGMGLDEFACAVIQKALNHRAEVRPKGRTADR
jgi:hypothetical protein